jgi:antitoxin (DNA-binding transcriptional repressor) of toxin-antitoxin stability system
MDTISVAQAKAHLSELVDRVKRASRSTSRGAASRSHG